jgi:uncharacterized phage infection (PIP) family protein YhgE
MLSLAVLPTAIVITYQQSIRNLKIMRLRIRTILCCTAIFSAVSFFTITFAETNPLSKAQVAERIAKVENGVDDFEKYLTSRGENAKDQAGSAKSSGAEKSSGATKRGQGENSANKDARKDQAKDQAGQSKDDLQNAMDDLNRTTNRLRRKFDETANYLETKVQMEQVMDSARKVNQVVGKGGNDGQAQSLWKALRASINDLARAYNLTPVGA